MTDASAFVDVGAVDEALQKEEKPLREQALDVFSLSPQDFAKQAWLDGAKQLQMEYGPENVDFRTDDNGQPVGFTVNQKTIHGDYRTYEVSGKETQARIDRNLVKRARLREELMAKAETITPSERFLKQFKFAGSEGPVNFLKEMYPGANVLDLGEGVQLISREGQEPLVTDSSRWSLPELAGDVADVQVDAARVVPGAAAQAAAAYVTGNKGPLKQAAVQAGAAGVADALAEAGIQGVGAMLPGEENVKTSDRVGRVLANAAMGMGAELGMQGLAAGGRFLSPSRAAAKAYAKEPVVVAGKEVTAREAAQQAEKELQAAGFKEGEMSLTPGQIGGFRAREQELALRASERGQPAFKMSDTAQMRNLQRRFNEVLEKAYGDARRVGAEGAGTMVVKSYDDLVKGLYKEHAKEADKAFGAAMRLAGNEPVISGQPILDALQKSADYYAKAGGSAEADLVKSKAAKKAKELLFDATKRMRANAIRNGMTPEVAANIFAKPQDVMLPISELQKLMADWGPKAARTSQFAIKDVSPSASKRYAQNMFGGLQDALDDAIARGVPGAAELRAAKEQFKAGLSQIADKRVQALEQLLKKVVPSGKDITLKTLKNPEQIAEFVVRSTDNQKVATFMKALEGLDPEAHKAVAAAGFEKLFQRARPRSFIAGDESIVMDPERFAQIVLGKDKDRVLALAGEGSPLAGELQALASVAKKVARTANQYPAEKGGVAGLLREGVRLVSSTARFSAGPGTALITAAEAVQRLFRPKTAAKMFTDPKSVRELMRLAQPPKWYGRRAATRALEHLVANYLRDDEDTQPAEVTP